MSAIKTLRKVGNIEGISYLLLLGVAMPLKYFADIPTAVKIAGSIHGFLFVWFMFSLMRVWLKAKWSYDKVAIAFILSIIPFGTFYLDQKIKKEYPGN
ncbi:MAG: DUF3817 domain-containing protein [Bacteroidota bacterium]